jgi:hypothetical protein
MQVIPIAYMIESRFAEVQPHRMPMAHRRWASKALAFTILGVRLKLLFSTDFRCYLVIKQYFGVVAPVAEGVATAAAKQLEPLSVIEQGLRPAAQLLLIHSDSDCDTLCHCITEELQCHASKFTSFQATIRWLLFKLTNHFTHRASVDSTLILMPKQHADSCKSLITAALQGVYSSSPSTKCRVLSFWML